MKLWAVQRKNIIKITVFSMAVVLINLAALRYLAANTLSDVNMAGLNGKTIVIDPGHGGIDSGASAHGVVEKEINLAISLKLAEILQSHNAVVILTRDADIDYYTRGKGGKRNDLLKRIEIIEATKPDVFISIHCNAINSEALFGAQVFYSPKLEGNKPLAEIMQQAVKDFSPGNRRQSKQDLHILLLNASNIAGVLIEVGYLTNRREASLLADSAYQQKLVEQVAKALAYHFSQNAAR